MDDSLTCPLCDNKLRNINLPNRSLLYVEKTSDYTERVCSNGHNHVLMMFVDNKTKRVDLLRMSLNPKYSRFIEIDFVNNKCRIDYKNEGKSEYIDVAKMIYPDFPHLTTLRERVDLYILFS